MTYIDVLRLLNTTLTLLVLGGLLYRLLGRKGWRTMPPHLIWSAMGLAMLLAVFAYGSIEAYLKLTTEVRVPLATVAFIWLTIGQFLSRRDPGHPKGTTKSR